ncbi:MAG: hypothetical protein H6R48_512, partial [Proteobacteria bacterium]|nr:hypothetical protein [Pseudomonadota bacterium]
MMRKSLRFIFFGLSSALMLGGCTTLPGEDGY